MIVGTIDNEDKFFAFPSAFRLMSEKCLRRIRAPLYHCICVVLVDRVLYVNVSVLEMI